MAYIVLFCWLGACAFQDAQHRKIANLLTLGGLCVALAYLLWSGSSLTGASPPAVVLAIGIACLLSLPGYLSRQMGAADVKMLVALGAASDAAHVLFSVIGAALVLIIWVTLVRIWPDIRLALPKRLAALRTTNAKAPPMHPFCSWDLHLQHCGL
ncbi:A24 family peptidase [Pseudomonas sp. MM211]|uniref:A24 family peptidase n=1 Tax=Pseudomonas sp. MM211 TaxID=2866808 RepID=UPI001CEC155B|nr:A24 family peptidase [Pseudomonas sp. MM211]UCJ17685.1 A24 family peptidase [Pseudomonas sp. MM211]